MVIGAPVGTNNSIVWLASYPRSGNTFVRALLANYFSAVEHPFDINDLPHLAHGEHDEPLWQALTGKPSILRSPSDEWRFRLDYFSKLRTAPVKFKIRLVKTHSVNVSLFRDEPFGFQPDDKIIHIVRHPLDVAVSVADFHGWELPTAVEYMILSGAYIDGRPAHGYEIKGSWKEHALSWLRETKCPIITVKYSNLVQDTAVEFTRILKFLGFERDPGRVAFSAECAAFDKLFKQETMQAFLETPSKSKSKRFFRVGKPRQWQDVLTREQAFRVADSCQELLSHFGYVHPKDVAFSSKNATDDRIAGAEPNAHDEQPIEALRGKEGSVAPT